MRRLSIGVAALTSLALAACGDAGTGPEELSDDLLAPVEARAGVLNPGSSGAGSLAEAITQANSDPSIRVINVAKSVGTIVLEEPLVYTGSQKLRINGFGAVIDASNVEHGLVSTGGADITLRKLTIQNAISHGLHVDVPGDATGYIATRLEHVTLQGNGLYGLWVDDQTDNSDASVSVDIRFSTVAANGFRTGDNFEFQDYDGVRIDEGGLGGVLLTMHRTDVVDNAADGLEVDEKGPGDVFFRVNQTHFDGNGEQPQTDPDDPDLEDGFDIDEADEGNIKGSILQSTAKSNYDEGIDFDEEGAGDIRVTMTQVVVSDNTDEYIKFSEDADVEDSDDPAAGSGGIHVRFTRVTANGSLDDGIQLEEFGAGDLIAWIVRSTAIDNDDDGLDVEQSGNGVGRLKLFKVTVEPNGGDPVSADRVDVMIKP